MRVPQTIVSPLLPLLLVAGLVGCASVDRRVGWRVPLVRAIAARGLDPAAIMAPLELDASMRAWAAEAVDGLDDDEARVRALLARLIDPNELRLVYVWGYTGTAREVFAQRQANCLAFTTLFISMARSVGLDVGYLLVRDVETFRKEGDLVVISDHVAAGFGHGPSRLVIDLSREPRRGDRRIEAISDLTALSLFHSNRGAEALQENDPEAALAWLEVAVVVDAEYPGSWVNYGVALRRAGHADQAEAAYRRALEVDPSSSSAWTNLASLLRLEGRDDEARSVERALGQRPGRNPFTYLALAEASRGAGRWEEASRLFQRAIGLNRDDPEAYARWGMLAFEMGDRRAARRLLRRAQRRGPNHPETQRLAQLLEHDDGT